jgi:hypothetical protein
VHEVGNKIEYIYIYICIYTHTHTHTHILSGPGGTVGIATELRAGRFGDRIPVGRDFSPVQIGPGAHPASCTMGTESFPGVKCGRGVLLTTHPLLTPRSWKVRAIPLTPFWATTGPVTGILYLTYIDILPRREHTVRICCDVYYHRSYRRKVLCANS